MLGLSSLSSRMAEQGSSKLEAATAAPPAPIVVKAHGQVESPEGSPRTSAQQQQLALPPSSYFKLYRWVWCQLSAGAGCRHMHASGSAAATAAASTSTVSACEDLLQQQRRHEYSAHPQTVHLVCAPKAGSSYLTGSSSCLAVPACWRACIQHAVKP